jgi:uracil-DNA glycosylase family 4
MDRDEILREIASQIEGELARGISVWADPDWNEAARRFLEAGASAGVPRPTPAGSAARLPMTRGSATGPAAASAPPRPPKASLGPPPPATDRAPDWDRQLAALGAEASACTRCRLHETRTQAVFNSGSGEIPLVFVGEAPGADEDAQGEAFVGRAGQLLTRIIAAIGLNRRDVYICNVLKCRPPENRNPLPDEIQTCSPFLEKQLDLLKPRVICALGLFAAQLLLESKAPIGKLRGRLFRYRGIPLLPTYHPAALLRNPGLKRTVWEDVQLLRKILDEGVTPATEPSEVPEKAKTTRGPVTGDLFT